MPHLPTSHTPAIAEGLTVYSKLRGPERAQHMQDTIDSNVVGSAMTALSMEFVFGRVWSRNGLDAKQRSLVTIGLLIGLRQTKELQNHFRIGLTNGLSVKELEETTIQAAAYAGFPAARAASDALLEVLRERAAVADQIPI